MQIPENNSNSSNNNHPQNSPSGEFSGRSLFFVLLLTLIAFVLVSSTFYFVALYETVLDEYGSFPDPQLIMDNQDHLIDLMLDKISAGVGAWPLYMQILWMMNQLIILFPALLFLRARRLPAFIHLRIRPVQPSYLIYGAFIGLSIAVLGDELTRIVDLIQPIPDSIGEQMVKMLTYTSFQEFLVLFLTICIIAPFTEEAVFRGLTQRWFERNRGVTKGVLATSAIFAFVHANMYFLLPILILATILGAVAWRVESILPSVVIHAVNNTLGLLLTNKYGTTDPEWYVFKGHIAPWWLLLAGVVLYFSLKRLFENAERDGLGGHGPSGDSGTNINTVA